LGLIGNKRQSASMLNLTSANCDLLNALVEVYQTYAPVGSSADRQFGVLHHLSLIESAEPDPNPAALCICGVYQFFGVHRKAQSFVKAREMWERAAKLGSAMARCNLAVRAFHTTLIVMCLCSEIDLSCSAFLRLSSV
jgi:hypothetical protein